MPRDAALERLCNNLARTRSGAYTIVARDAIATLRKHAPPGYPSPERRVFSANRAGIIFTQRTPFLSRYATPLSLNIIRWHNQGNSPTAMSIAQRFDLDICMFGIEVDNALRVTFTHPNANPPAVGSRAMHFTSYAWSGTAFVFSTRAEMKWNVNVQMVRLLKYYKRGYTLSLPSPEDLAERDPNDNNAEQ